MCTSIATIERPHKAISTAEPFGRQMQIAPHKLHANQDFEPRLGTMRVEVAGFVNVWYASMYW